MNKHTPGPWEVHEGENYIVVLRGDETTAQGIPVDNIEDARLIAAAPELLWSGNEFLAWFKEFIGKDAFAEINSKELNAFIAAMTKATA